VVTGKVDVEKFLFMQNAIDIIWDSTSAHTESPTGFDILGLLRDTGI